MIPVITGVGLVTPLGRSAPATWRALLDGRCISTHARLEPTTPDSAIAPKGHSLSRISAFACEAADEAIDHAGWTGALADTAVIACTSKGAVENWMPQFPLAPGSAGVARSRTPAKPGADGESCAVFGLADLSSAIAQHIGAIHGPRVTLSAACASGLHGLIRGAMMIQSGEAKRVLVVAAEASVHPLFLASFRRLGVLPADGELCRPFDLRRSGFLMSETAAAVCLESRGSDRSIVAVDRYAIGGDATHLTASDPDARVLKYLLGKVIDDRPVDLIHAHGTGTRSNDSTELSAIEASLRGDRIASLYSHKGALGHSLGASGLVSVVLNCLAHQSGIVPGNVNSDQPIDAVRVSIDQTRTARRVRRSIVHAAGFGGPTAVLGLVSLTAQDR